MCYSLWTGRKPEIANKEFSVNLIRLVILRKPAAAYKLAKQPKRLTLRASTMVPSRHTCRPEHEDLSTVVTHRPGRTLTKFFSSVASLKRFSTVISTLITWSSGSPFVVIRVPLSLLELVERAFRASSLRIPSTRFRCVSLDSPFALPIPFRFDVPHTEHECVVLAHCTDLPLCLEATDPVRRVDRARKIPERSQAVSDSLAGSAL